jgi:hypothetical protein
MKRIPHARLVKDYRAQFSTLLKPAFDAFPCITPLVSGCNRVMKFDFEHQLKALVYLHLQGFESGRELVQALREDSFACTHVAPADGVEKSAFFEAMHSRGVTQLLELFHILQDKARGCLPNLHPRLGKLVGIDGSLIDAVPSMHFADYRKGSKKAKVHLGFNLNQGVPAKMFLSNGKADERPFVSQLLDPGQTGVMDRGYQCHKQFDQWQREGKHFVCRIKKSTHKTILQEHPVSPGGIVFLDVTALLGSQAISMTAMPVRVVGYRVEGKEYYVATDRFDLSATDVALIYKLRWDIEIFFGWWKRHLKVYHLVARSEHGLMVQILAGLITYLLLAIYCHEQHNEKVSIARVRELRFNIHNELVAAMAEDHPPAAKRSDPHVGHSYAIL